MDIQPLPGKSYQLTIGPTQQWCVYAHRYGEEVFYIGQGRLGRPFDVMGRNAHWHQFVDYVGTYTIEILGYFDTQTEAMREEERLIYLLLPSCNRTVKQTALERDWVPIRRMPVPLQSVSPAVRIIQLQAERDRLMTKCEQLMTVCEGLRHRCQALVKYCRPPDLHFWTICTRGIRVVVKMLVHRSSMSHQA